MTASQTVQHALKEGLDIAAIATAGGTLLGLLPPLAAGMSIIWLGMQMVDRHHRLKKEREESKDNN